MLVAKNSLGPVCPVPLTVRGTLDTPPAAAYFCSEFTSHDDNFQYLLGLPVVLDCRLLVGTPARRDHDQLA